MKNKNCYDCCMFMNNVELRQLNRDFGDEIFPFDVEWKNCLQGPDVYLNCRKRIEKEGNINHEKKAKEKKSLNLFTRQSDFLRIRRNI